MNIIDHTSDDIRQIVPADFSFLSDADQQITAALHATLAALLGGDGSETIVLQGCQITSDYDASESTVDGGIRIGPRVINYSMTDGLLLHRGRLYELPAASWTEANMSAELTVMGVTRTLPTGLIVFADQQQHPSPVYGQNLELSEAPHRRLTAAIEQATMSVNFNPRATVFMEDYSITAYNTQASDYIRALALKRLPSIGQFSHV